MLSAFVKDESGGGHSQAAGYTDRFKLGEMIHLSGVGT